MDEKELLEFFQEENKLLPPISLADYCQQFNTTEDEVYKQFLKENIIHHERTARNSDENETRLVFYSREPNVFDQALFDFYSNPNAVVRSIYQQKIKKYCQVRYAEWAEKGKVFGDDENDVHLNPDFKGVGEEHELFESFPPDMIKYGGDVVEFYGLLFKFCTFICTLPGANVILKFLNKRPTVVAPWNLWDDFNHTQKAVEQTINLAAGENLEKSTFDMSTDEIVSQPPSQPKFFSTQQEKENFIYQQGVDIISSKILGLAEITPDTSLIDESFFKVITQNTPIFAKTPSRMNLASQPSASRGGSRPKSAARNSILQKASVKRSAKKLNSDGKSGKTISRLNLEDPELTPDIGQMKEVQLKSTPQDELEGDGDLSLMKLDSDAEEETDSMETEMATIKKKQPLNPSRIRKLNSIQELRNSTADITPIIKDPKKSVLLNKHLLIEEEQEQGSSTIEPNSDDIENKLSHMSLKKEQIEVGLEASEMAEVSVPEVGGMAEEGEVSKNDSTSTNGLIQQADRILNQSPSRGENSNLNPIFKNPNKILEENSDEYESDDDFSCLINRKNQQNSSGFGNITLNAKLTPIAKFNEKYNESPSSSPINKRSKPSSTPNAPIHKNSKKFDSADDSTQIIGRVDDSKNSLGSGMVESPRYSGRTVRRSNRLSCLSEKSDDSLNSKPVVGTVAKMKEKFNAPKPLNFSSNATRTSSNSASKSKFGFTKKTSQTGPTSSAFTQKEGLPNLASKPFRYRAGSNSEENRGWSINRNPKMAEGGLNLAAEPIIKRPNMKSAKEKAEEAKREKLRKQKEKTEQAKKAAKKLEEQRQNEMKLKAQKNKERQEAVKKRREEQERKRQEKEKERQQEKATASAGNASQRFNSNTSLSESFRANSAETKKLKNNFKSKLNSLKNNEFKNPKDYGPNPLASKSKAMNQPMSMIDEADLESEEEDENDKTINCGPSDEYNATFNKEPIPSTADNYLIDDLESGDETDDENEPKKRIPDWAKGARLHSMARNIACYESNYQTEFFPVATEFKPGDLDISNADILSTSKITNEIVNLCPLGDIFVKKKEDFYKRNSTGIWRNTTGRRDNILREIRY